MNVSLGVKTFKNKKFEELKDLPLAELSNYLNARARRVIKRGIPKAHLLQIDKAIKKEVPQRTHYRAMLILPKMVGLKMLVHNGKKFIELTINEEMLGTKLGDYVATRAKIKHSKPGVGASRSTKFCALK